MEAVVPTNQARQTYLPTKSAVTGATSTGSFQTIVVALKKKSVERGRVKLTDDTNSGRRLAAERRDRRGCQQNSAQELHDCSCEELSWIETSLAPGEHRLLAGLI